MFSQDKQIKKFGIRAEVILMDFVIKVGRSEAKLPAALLQREGLDLTAEGVKSNAAIKEIFKAPYQGAEVQVADHRGEVVSLVKPGDEITLAWARNKLTALCQWVQELGEHLDRKEGWMFAKSDLGEVMQRVAFIQRRRDELLDILISVHSEANTAYLERIVRIGEKLRVVLEQELAAAQAKVDAERLTAEGVTRETQQRHRKLERQLASLPDFLADLRSRFPSVSTLQSEFIFSNTTPKELPSVLGSLQGNAEAMQAIVEAEEAEQGQAYAAAIRNGINLMSDTIREKVADISDQFYGEIAFCLKTLEELGDTRKFGPSVKDRVNAHVERLGVLSRLLAGFQALESGDEPLDHTALMSRLQSFQQAFDADARQGNGIGSGREALLGQLQAYREELSGTVLGANLYAAGVGVESLADWVEAGLEPEFDAQAPITEQGADVREMTVML